MKKILAVLFGFVLIILESTLFSKLKVAGVIPNLTLIAVMSFGLVEGNRWGRNLGFLMGITQDILFTQHIGFYALLYFYLGHISGYGQRGLRRSNLFFPLLLILLGDLIYGILNFLFRAMLFGRTDFAFYWSRIILPEAAYTAFWILPVYCLIAGCSRLLSRIHVREMFARNFAHHERIES